MKALSVKQPWANFIAQKRKTIETRTWRTKYRGEILIVSSRKPPLEPAGCAVAIASIVDCRPMTKDDEEAACCELYPGAWAWVLNDIRKLEEPFSVNGRLGIFEVSMESVRE